MLKRRYGDRSGWRRILKRKYAQANLDTLDFKGYITLLKLEKVSEPLVVQYDDFNVCIVDDGYFWLQQFPTNQHHVVTTMFNASGEIVQWYVDICLQSGVNENLVPWFDDLYLDIIKLPTCKIIQKDADELEAALSNGIINEALYKLAWEEANQVLKQIESNQFSLLNLSKKHKNLLLEKLF